MVRSDELLPAGFGRRLAAAAIDTALLAMLLLVVFAVVVVVAAILVAAGALTDAETSGDRLLLATLIGFVALAWLYSALLHVAPWQATIGKLLLGLRVTDRLGRRISFPRATLRHAASLAVYLTLSIGFLVVLVPGSRQALHDGIAGTLVVRRRPAPAIVRPAPTVALPDRPQPTAAVSPDGRWWWDGQRWQPMTGRAFVPLPPVSGRVTASRRAAGLALSVAVLFFGGCLLVLVLAAVGNASPWLTGAAVVAVVLGVLGLLAMLPTQAGRRRRAWDAAAAAAFERLREDGEAIEASTYAYVGPRPWVLNLVLSEWIVRLVLPQGCLVVTDRRLLLFGVDQLRGRIDRLDRAEDIAGVHVRTFSRGLLRPRIVLAVEGRPALQVTLPFTWGDRAEAVVAAIGRQHP